MTNEELNTLVIDITEHINKSLTVKGNEYARTKDRLKNFKDAGDFQEETPERALLGMVSKHIIALKDFILDLDAGKLRPMSQWQEKTRDIINYMILLEGLLKERGLK